jgi:uncharacterized protein YfaS (alpha-2-macroglobulin family)
LVKIDILGSYYAGGPVKHGRVRYKIAHGPTSFAMLGFDNYSFGFQGEERGGQVLESGEAVLDEAGRLAIEFPLDQELLGGRRGLKVSATVIDFDGRAAGADKLYQAEPDFLVGLGPHPEEVVSGSVMTMPLVVLDKSGQRVKRGLVEAQLLQQSGAYLRKRNEAGDVYWEHQSFFRKLLSSTQNLENGEAQFKFDFPYGGRFLVAATYRDEEGRAFTSATAFEVRGDFLWDAYYNKDKPFEAMPVAADREAYKPGDKARIFFQPQRPVAAALVTLEQDGILDYRVVDGKGGTQGFDLGIKEAYAPNVFVSVLGLCPRGAFPSLAGRYDDEAPAFLFGTVNLSDRKSVV